MPPPHFGLRTYGGVIGLALPGWTGSLGGEAFFEGHAWRAALGARFRFATTAQLEGEGGGEFSYVAGRVTGCGILRAQLLDYPLCGAVEAGQIRAVGTGVDEPLTSRRPWISVRAVPGLSHRTLDWLALGLELDLGYVISQERYFLRDIGVLHNVGAFEFGANLSVQFRFFGRRK